jgi:uncharacterized protein
MKPKIGLITLGVTDLERSTRFYRDGMGFPQHGNYPGVTFFALNGTWLGLYPRADLARDAHVDEAGTGFRGFRLAHNVASKEEVDSVLNEAEKAGGRIVKKATEAKWGGYSGYFSDPDGFLWEVAWNPHFDLT